MYFFSKEHAQLAVTSLHGKVVDDITLECALSHKKEGDASNSSFVSHAKDEEVVSPKGSTNGFHQDRPRVPSNVNGHSSRLPSGKPTAAIPHPSGHSHRPHNGYIPQPQYNGSQHPHGAPLMGQPAGFSPEIVYFMPAPPVGVPFDPNQVHHLSMSPPHLPPSGTQVAPAPNPSRSQQNSTISVPTNPVMESASLNTTRAPMNTNVQSSNWTTVTEQPPMMGMPIVYCAPPIYSHQTTSPYPINHVAPSTHPYFPHHPPSDYGSSMNSSASSSSYTSTAISGPNGASTPSNHSSGPNFHYPHSQQSIVPPTASYHHMMQTPPQPPNQHSQQPNYYPNNNHNGYGRRC